MADLERAERDRGEPRGAWPGWWPTPPTAPRWWSPATAHPWRRWSGSSATPSSVQLRDDLRDLALVIGRAADDDGRRHALDDVVDTFGRARRES